MQLTRSFRIWFPFARTVTHRLGGSSSPRERVLVSYVSTPKQRPSEASSERTEKLNANVKVALVPHVGRIPRTYR